MRAVVWTKSGAPEVLQLQEVAKPVPRDSEVLIKIYATTVTAADCEFRRSSAPTAFRVFGVIKNPIILGQELAGEIEAVGAAVSRFKPGDQVAAWSGLRLGSYAEYHCLSEKAVISLKPTNMTYEEAAPLPVGGLDATFFMRQARLARGQKVLINGAGGTIGTYAVQLARYFGAEVTAVDSAGKLDMLREIGADHVIDYAREDFSRSGETYDAIFDVIGKTAFARSIRCLTPDGRYLLANPRLNYLVRGRLLSMTGGKRVIPWSTRKASQYADDFAFLKERVEGGSVRSIIDRVFPLEQIADAHRYVESGQKKGHVVITMA